MTMSKLLFPTTGHLPLLSFCDTAGAISFTILTYSLYSKNEIELLKAMKVMLKKRFYNSNCGVNI